MKKERTIIIFYLLYFGWLFTVTYLTTDPLVLDFYAIAVVLIYFAFMREPWDAFLFGLVSLIPLYLHREAVQFTPLWIPVVWGTSAIALRKFFVLMVR